MPDYKKTLKYATKIKNNAEKKQELGESSGWSYYFAKIILNVDKSVKQISIKNPKAYSGSYISRDIYKSSYLDMAERLVKYVEKNSQLPAFIKFTTKSNKVYEIPVKMYTYLFAKILVEYDKNKKFPSKVNISSKVFVKETETKNDVFNWFVKKAGFTPKYLDDVCDWVKNHVDYEFYYDDYKSNLQVIESRAGNCTDLLQFLINMADALGYDWEVIHTQCRQSGTGHVYGRFKKKGSSEWFIRDVACIADESTYCIWCNVDTGGGYLLAKNPAWFLGNLHR